MQLIIYGGIGFVAGVAVAVMYPAAWAWIVARAAPLIERVRRRS